MMSFINKFVFIILLCVIFCFGWSTQKKVIPVPKPFVEPMRLQAAACSKESGAPAETLKKILNWSVPNEIPSKKFLLCIATSTGFSNETGHINEDKLGALKPQDGTQEEFVQAIKDCNKVSKEEAYDNMYASAECITNLYDFKVEN